MRTRKSLTMALTIVIALAASALLVWQIPPEHVADHSIAQRTADHVATPETGAIETFGAAQLQDNHQDLGAAMLADNEPAPNCRFGFTQSYDEDGSKGDYECMRSGYWDYTTDTLERMVYADAEAARVLAHRLKETDYPRALQLALRSAALSHGDVTAIMESRNWRPTAHKNGDTDVAGLTQYYMLLSLAHKIHYGDYDRSTRIADILRRASDYPDETIDRVDQIILRAIEDLRQIELDVTGQSTIGGDEDA